MLPAESNMGMSTSLNMLMGVLNCLCPDGDGFQEVLGCGKCSINVNCMDELIQAECEDSEGEPPNQPHHTK